MNMKPLVSLLFCCSLLLSGFAVAYDKPFMVEVNAGPAWPFESIGDTDADIGFSLATSVSYSFWNDMLGIYFDYSIEAFQADSPSRTEPNLDGLNLYSYGVGVSHQGSFGSSRFGYFVRVGLHNSQLALVDRDADEIDETRFETGFQTSAGVRFDLSRDWSLRGGLRYKSFSKNLKNTDVTNDAELNSVTLTFGGSYRF